MLFFDVFVSFSTIVYTEEDGADVHSDVFYLDIRRFLCPKVRPRLFSSTILRSKPTIFTVLQPKFDGELSRRLPGSHNFYAAI